MCGTCGAVISVLILAAGGVLYGNVAAAGLTSVQLAGVLFVLVGLGKLVHAGGMCSMCKGK